jgi:hypothetical protein
MNRQELETAAKKAILQNGAEPGQFAIWEVRSQLNLKNYFYFEV